MSGKPPAGGDDLWLPGLRYVCDLFAFSVLTCPAGPSKPEETVKVAGEVAEVPKMATKEGHMKGA